MHEVLVVSYVPGPGAFLSASTCALLERLFDVAGLRVQIRGRNPGLTRELEAMHRAALEHVSSLPSTSSASGVTGGVTATEQPPPSEPMTYTAAQVAVMAKVSPHGVRQARRRGQIAGVETPSGWRFEPAAVAAWMATRKEAG